MGCGSSKPPDPPSPKVQTPATSRDVTLKPIKSDREKFETIEFREEPEPEQESLNEPSRKRAVVRPATPMPATNRSTSPPRRTRETLVVAPTPSRPPVGGPTRSRWPVRNIHENHQFFEFEGDKVESGDTKAAKQQWRPLRPETQSSSGSRVFNSEKYEHIRSNIAKAS